MVKVKFTVEGKRLNSKNKSKYFKEVRVRNFQDDFQDTDLYVEAHKLYPSEICERITITHSEIMMRYD